MKNKIYFYNFSQEKLEASHAEIFYDLYFLTGEIEEFAYFTTQGILVYDPQNQMIGKTFPYYRDIILVNDDVLNIISEADKLLAYLDRIFGRKRLVNPKQFEMIIGSVVRSKVQLHLGAGYVKKIDGDYALVHFPKAKKLSLEPDVICHKSVLRVITHIKEVQFEEQQST